MTEQQEVLYCEGANDMRLAIWHNLAPALKSVGYTDSNLALIFKEVGLLYPVTVDQIDEIKEQATTEYYLKEIEKVETTNNKSTKA